MREEEGREEREGGVAGGNYMVFGLLETIVSPTIK